LVIGPIFRAGYGIRTHDIQLGKQSDAVADRENIDVSWFPSMDAGRFGCQKVTLRGVQPVSEPVWLGARRRRLPTAPRTPLARVGWAREHHDPREVVGAPEDEVPAESEVDAGHGARVSSPGQPRCVARRRRIVVVPWPGPPRRWARLATLHGSEVEYDSTPEAVLVRVSTWTAPIDSPLRVMAPEDLERELVAIAERVLGIEADR
jgi:hypothetical protein